MLGTLKLRCCHKQYAEEELEEVPPTVPFAPPTPSARLPKEDPSKIIETNETTKNKEQVNSTNPLENLANATEHPPDTKPPPLVPKKPKNVTDGTSQDNQSGSIAPTPPKGGKRVLKELALDSP
jgi:hypothetical protein